MKKATSSTALALLIGTVVFFTAAETKAAQTYAIDVIDTGSCTSTETYAGTETYTGTETYNSIGNYTGTVDCTLNYF